MRLAGGGHRRSCLTCAVQRIPLISGAGVTVVTAADDALVLRPPAPSDHPIADVGAAVRDALRFPLAGPPLESLVPREAGRRRSSSSRPRSRSRPPSTTRGSTRSRPRSRSWSAPGSRPAARRSSSPAASGAGPGAPSSSSSSRRSSRLRFHGLVNVHDVEADDLVPIGQRRAGAAACEPGTRRDRPRRRRDRGGDRPPRRGGRAARRVRRAR